MECNKEEALRCKALSEATFKRNDLVGARKFAVKARQLFPELEGLPQLFSILDVHIAACQKLRTGESNCYGILQVDFRADDDTIRKQYRKLALVLHPDKNKAFGAEAAFKHISEAWSVLSDKHKKLGFHQRWLQHMAACATHPTHPPFQNPDAFCSPHVSVSRVNPSKSPNVNWAQQPLHRQQGAHVHSHQGQFHARVFQQGHGQAHARQQEQQGHRQAHVPQQQGQGQTMASQQQGQCQTHASPLQGQAQQQGRVQARAFEQQWQSQRYVNQQQGHDKSYAHQGQGQAHGHEQQGQSQWYVNQQQGHDKSYVHQGQGQAHGHEQQEQDQQVHLQHQQGQGPMHAHQQRGQGTTQVQGQAHQAPHVHQQQGQGSGHAHPQQGAQGQAHQAPVPPGPQNSHAHTNIPSQPAFEQSKSTFWTACPSCRMQIEYERAHMNKCLCCPMCYKAFVSKEIEPVQGAVLWPPPISQSKPDLKTDAGIKIGLFDSNSDWIPRSDSTLPAMAHSNKKVKIRTEDNLTRQHGHQKPQEAPVQPAQKPVELQQKGLGRLEKDKLRKRVALHTKEGLERLIARSKNVIVQKLSEEKERKAAADKASAIGQNQKADNERSALASGPSTQKKPVAAENEQSVYSTEEKTNDFYVYTSRLRTRNSTKPCKEARVSLKGSRFVPAKTGGCKGEALQWKRKLASPMNKSVEDENEGVSSCIKECKSYQGSKDMEVSEECSLQVDGVDGLADKCMMEVPDPDFHSFDGDRTEDHFASGQIWASYDDDDGMPRYYGLINKILSRQPLKMQMNWLEAQSPSAETLAWLTSGFQHSCGDFELGSMYVAEEVSTFSHLMAVVKGPKGGFKIYPRQGDVWAVYKDWEILKVKEDKRGYDMVEIVADFDEEKGLQVCPLSKVAGFKTVFERKRGEDHVKWIPQRELRRLSHQVPIHHILSGDVPGIQVDYLELDPASTPLNLIYE